MIYNLETLGKKITEEMKSNSNLMTNKVQKNLINYYGDDWKKYLINVWKKMIQVVFQIIMSNNYNEICVSIHIYSPPKYKTNYYK
jgi:hypothetical protein